MKNFKLFVFVLLTSLFAMGSHTGYAASESLSAPVQATQEGKININTADANLLASTLKGVGLKKAQAIVDYRETYGPFVNIRELVDVKGIGNSTLQKNAHLVGVE